jgi:hypothetical protein
VVILCFTLIYCLYILVFIKIYALLTDSFGIILRNQNGEYIEVLEMELDRVWNIIIKIKNIIINSEVLIIFLIKSNYVFSISYILPLERFYFLFEK